MNYERKYNEALERAKSFELPEYKNIMVSIFPELRENEDERIRKSLITYFQSFPYDSIENAGTNVKEVLTWLEKQGEQTPKWTDEDEKNFNNIDIILFEYKNLPKENYWKIINWIRSIKQRMEEKQ